MLPFFGLILLACAAALLFYFARRNVTMARELTATENFTPSQLVELHGEVIGDADVAGAFRQAADARGAACCASPLTSPMSGSACVYFESRVIAKIEELQTHTDSNGHSTEQWVSRDREMSRKEQGATFELADGGATVTVCSQGAKIDGAVTIVDRFEPSNDNGNGGPSVSIGNFSLDLGTGSGGQRLLGYRHVECIVPVDSSVFVHGTVDDSTGQLAFRPAEGRPLMISTRSEEEITTGALKIARWQQLGSIGCAVAGGALTVAALVA